MKHGRAGRTSQQQHGRRRYPFTESTKLIELVDKKHYGNVVNLIELLKPYLIDEGQGPFLLTGLFFDLEKVKGQRQCIILELASFLKKVKDDGGLKCSQNVFFRYLSSPEHCNLAISWKSLKVLISKAIRQYF